MVPDAGLIVLVGLPGSGKTTLARQMALPELVVSTDAVRAELFGDEAIQGPWPQVEARVNEMLLAAKAKARDVQLQLGQAKSDPPQSQPVQPVPVQPVIYDATNVVRRQRRRFLGQARMLGLAPLYGCWLDLPLDLCLERNRQRSRRVPDAVVQRMYRCLTGAPPQLSDGFDGLVRVSRLADLRLAN